MDAVGRDGGAGFVFDGLYLRAIYKLNKQNMRKQQLRPYLDQRFGRQAPSP
jgi:hypothetical protein